MQAMFNRRQFVQATAGCGGLAFCGLFGRPVVVGAETPRRIPLGFSLYGMKDLPVEQAVRACAEIGYDAVELTLLPGWQTEPVKFATAARRRLRQLLADLKLELPALMENLPIAGNAAAQPGYLDRLKRAMQLARELAPDTPPVIETVLGGKPAQWESVRRQMADRLSAWADVAARAEVVVAIKPHVSGAMHTPEKALWLLGKVDSPWIKLAYDYSHFQLQGLAMRETIQQVVPRAAFIHVKDCRGDAGRVEFLLPGEGTINYVDYLQQVAAAGYEGSIVVEVSSQIFRRDGYDPIAAARRSYTHLAAAWKQAGIRRS